MCSHLDKWKGLLFADVLIETEEDGKLAMALFGKFKEYSPTFQGPAKPEDSVKSVLDLVNKATVDGGYAGVFISHTEGKPYLWDCVPGSLKAYWKRVYKGLSFVD